VGKVLQFPKRASKPTEEEVKPQTKAELKRSKLRRSIEAAKRKLSFKLY
jgi:hypothetical protein